MNNMIVACTYISLVTETISNEIELDNAEYLYGKIDFENLFYLT